MSTELDPAAWYDEGDRTIFHGNNLATLAGIPDASFDNVVSDPPYGLGFMGKEWDADVPDSKFWAEVLRVCKPGAMALIFAGTRTFPFMALNMIKAGWELRDCLMWLYGTGFPKSFDVSKGIDKHFKAARTEVTGYKKTGLHHRAAGDNTCGGFTALPENAPNENDEVPIRAPAPSQAREWDGYGTALKPAWEPILLLMKPLDGSFAENALEHGVAGLNIGATRIGTASVGWSGGAGLTGYSDVMEGAPRGEARPVVGRWPANVLLDETAAEMLDEQSGVMKSRRATIDTSGNGNFADPTMGADRGGPREVGFNDQGGASRFFYVAKPTDSDKGYYNIHPTVKPTRLMEYLLKLVGTPTGGITLDPFMGSGTTLVAAKKLGRMCVGMERDLSYCLVAKRRLEEVKL